MDIHRLLKRQVKKILGRDDLTLPTAEQWQQFLERVNHTYTEADQDRYTLERSLSLSSEEMPGLYDQVRSQAAQLAEWNKTLEQRVKDQVDQIQRLERLKRFFSPQLAEMIVSGSTEDPLKSHRREVTVIFVDLRGFTSFAETAEPEEVMKVLREYHAEVGGLVMEYEVTLERFTGDGLMIILNDPVPIDNPAEHAVRMAVAMRDQVATLLRKWVKMGYELGLGMGIAAGYATLGAIGFEKRWDYAAIGTVTNLAARLCGEARPGQILVPQRLLTSVEDLVEAEPVGHLTLKGFQRPVSTYDLLGLKG